jgi:large subunit ribosomal protein L9
MSRVKVILGESVPNLGEAGDLVSVKPGFARNYLVPQGKATLATAANVKELEHHKRVVAKKVERQREELEVLRDRIQSVVLEVSARVGEEGRLFGSVTVLQIAKLLAEKGFEIDRRKIDLAEPIREVGDHSVPIRLGQDLAAEVVVKVSAEE